MKRTGTAELDELLVAYTLAGRGPVLYPALEGAATPAGLRLRPKCHLEADFRAVYERPGGDLVLACSNCGAIVARVAVARL